MEAQENKLLNPMSLETQVALHNAEHNDSIITIEYLTKQKFKELQAQQIIYNICINKLKQMVETNEGNKQLTLYILRCVVKDKVKVVYKNDGSSIFFDSNTVLFHTTSLEEFFKMISPEQFSSIEIEIKQI